MEYRSLFNADFKHSLPSQFRRKRHHFLLPALMIGVIMVMGVVVAKVNISPSKSSAAKLAPISQTETIELALDGKSGHEPAIKYREVTDIPTEENAAVETGQKIETVRIRRGDSLSSIFNKRGLNKELHNIMQLGNGVKELKSIYPGQKIHFLLEGDNLAGIELETSVNRRLKISKLDNDYHVDEIVRDFETRIQVASSSIENSLFLAGQRAGLSAALIMELANVFGWDIDFALDIRSGDQFTVVYEEKFLDGDKIKDGTIVAAEFINAGNRYRAVQYTDSNGNTDYYSDNGRSMRKPFLTHAGRFCSYQFAF